MSISHIFHCSAARLSHPAIAFALLSPASSSIVSSSRSAWQLTGKEADTLVPVLEKIGVTIAQATRCWEFSNMVLEETKKHHVTIPDEIYSFWFMDGSPESVQEDGTGVFHRCREIMRKRTQGCTTTRSAASMTATTKPIQQPEPDVVVPIDNIENAKFSKHFYHFIGEVSFLMHSLMGHVGFDKQALERKRFELWLNAQPKVNDRDVSVHRLRQPSANDCGLVDIMVGKIKRGSNSSDSETLVKQGCHISFYALDTLTNMEGLRPEQQQQEQQMPNLSERPAEQVPIKCVTAKLVGSKANCSGIIQIDRPPRGCTLADLTAVYVLLKNEDYEDAEQSRRSTGTDALLCFQKLQRVYDSFDLTSLEGLMRLYLILYNHCKFPEVTDDNKNAHKFLVPSSFPEIMIRIIFMHHSLVNVRTTTENGLGRASAFRHAISCTFPSSKPLRCFSSRTQGTVNSYFDELLDSEFDKKQDSHIKTVLVPQLMLKVPTTVCLPLLSQEDALWHKGVTQMLLQQSRNDLHATDSATGMTLPDILSKVLLALVEQTNAVNYLASEAITDEHTSIISDHTFAKDLEIHFKQVIWAGFAGLWKHRNWSVLKDTFGREAEAFVRACLAHDDVKRGWGVKLEGNEAIVEELSKIKRCSGNEDTLHTFMVTDKRGSDESLEDEQQINTAVARVVQAERPDELRFLAYHVKNSKTNFNKLIGKGINSAGSPAVPTGMRLAALLSGFLVYDQASAMVAHSFVHNNGEVLVDLPSYVLQHPKAASSELPKVGQKLI